MKNRDISTFLKSLKKKDFSSETICKIPSSSGVYFVFRPHRNKPKFLRKSTGRWFRGKDPSISKKELMQYWDSASNILDKTDVLYVGKAKNLRERIKRYWKFGEGKPVAHWGGRYIWQIKYSKNFLLAWKKTKDDTRAGKLEGKLLAQFKKEYGCLPFANLRR
jgi:excinuclease UvrABC nuclease subunit